MIVLKLDTKLAPNEFSVLNQEPKKSIQWVKQTGLLKGVDDRPLIEKDKPTRITVSFPPDLLIKNNTSKNSHLEKIKACYFVI